MEKQYLPEKIVGEKVTLKKHVVELADKMFEYIKEDRERLSEFLPWPKQINSLQDEVDFINRCSESWSNQEAAHYGIYRNSDDEYMGNISPFGFHWANCCCEIGYWILGKFEGYGYISESVLLLEDTLYEIGFNRIVIMCDPKNKRSASIPKRLNYILEGILREAIGVDEEFRDLELYSKLKSDLRSKL